MHVSSAAVIPSSDMGVSCSSPSNVSTSEDYNSSDGGTNSSSDTKSSNPETPVITSSSNTINSVATSEDSGAGNADISVTQYSSDYYPNYLNTVILSINVKNNGPDTAQNVIIQDIQSDST